MARKGRKRFPLRRVTNSTSTGLTTLGAGAAQTAVTTGAADTDYRLVSVHGIWSMDGFSGTTNEGPIVVGYSHSDYTDAEVEECLEAATAINIGDKIARERANRLVRRVGVFSGDGTLNDGKPIKVKLNWAMNAASELKIWAYNDGTSTLTTGTQIKHNADLWVRDY